MTTTELIELLIKNEKGGISHKSREISLTINGKYMPSPQITLSSTGDGICGAEIDLDIDGDFMEEQEPKTDVLDKIRAEVVERRHLHQLNEVSIENSSANVIQALTWVLEVIDKYKAESEGE